MDEEKKDAEFVSGLICKKPNAKAPKWVLLKISIKCEELINFIQTHTDESGWINIDVKESKQGKVYCQIDTWKPDGNKKTKVDNHDETGPEIESEEDENWEPPF